MGYTRSLFGIVPHLTYQSAPQIATLMRRFGPEKIVVDIGAGGRRIAPHVQTLDFAPGPDTDIVADACATPFKDHSVDLVIATGFLEHIEDDAKWMVEMHRIIRPGGSLYIEVPFLQYYHDDPIDSRRFTAPGLARYLSQYGFEPAASGAHIGPTVSLLHMIAQYAALVFDGKSLPARIASNGTLVALTLLFTPLKYLDHWMIRKARAHRLAPGP